MPGRRARCGGLTLHAAIWDGVSLRMYSYLGGAQMTDWRSHYTHMARSPA
jgi:hypothetical protein